jgi:hypothetical protein
MCRGLQNESFRIKKKAAGCVSTVRSPENMEAVRQPFIRSLRRSARDILLLYEYPIAA